MVLSGSFSCATDRVERWFCQEVLVCDRSGRAMVLSGSFSCATDRVE